MQREQMTYVCVEAVRHELELAIWRNEGDGSVVVEARQTNTLMELDVFQLDRLALAACSSKCTHSFFISFLRLYYETVHTHVLCFQTRFCR